MLTGALALGVIAAGAAVVARERSAAVVPVEAERETDAGLPAAANLLYEAGRLVVLVGVDGRDSLRFILDTAAESSAITRAVADRLDVDASRVRRMRVVGVAGTRIMTSVALRSLAVGRERIEGVRAIVLDDDALGGGFDGLLGNDVLRRYDVEIDVPGGVLRLHAPASLRGSARRGALVALPMKPGRDGFVSFDATLGGASVHAILDTGTPVSLLNWRAAALAGVTPETTGVRERRGGTAGLDGVRATTHEYRFDGLAFGATRFPAGSLRIADLPLFRVAGVALEPAMLVGADLLRGCAAILAYSTRMVHVCVEPAKRQADQSS